LFCLLRFMCLLRLLCPQVASTLAASNKTMGVWDESFAVWNFSGTPALPQGSVLFAWTNPELAAAMTDAG